MRLHIKTKLNQLFQYSSGLYLNNGIIDPNIIYFKIAQNSLIIYPR